MPATPALQNLGALYPLYSLVIEEKKQKSVKARGLESSLQVSGFMQVLRNIGLPLELVWELVGMF
jgi:hypothetical protein